MKLAALTVRKPGYTYGAGTPIPRHWFAGSAGMTHLMNAFHIVVPQGERWLVRVMRSVAKQLDAPLRQQVMAFGAQEAQHALEHERFFDTLRAQDLPVDELAAGARRVATRVLWDRTPSRLRVAMVAGVEHYTSIFGAFGLRHDLSADAHPDLRLLLDWHAAEEIEHRAVAFDVLTAVDSRYSLRILGFIAATAFLFASFGYVTLRLLHADKQLLRWRTARDLLTGMAGRKGLLRLIPGALGYFRPGFHPSDNDHTPLADAAFERLSMRSAAA